MHVGPAAVDLQPCPAVEHALAPAADLEDLTGPADVTQGLRVEMPSLVDSEVPVAVRPVRALGTRPSQSDGRHSRQLAKTVSNVTEEGVIVHRPKLARPGNGRHQVFCLPQAPVQAEDRTIGIQVEGA